MAREGGGQAPDILDLLVESPNAVFVLDMGQRIILWNRGAQRLLGWTAEEVLGKRCFEVFTPAQLQGHSLGVCVPQCFAIQLARQGQMPPIHRSLLQTKKGGSRWMTVVHVLVPGHRPEASALVHILQDVTQEVQALETVHRLVAFLAQAPTEGEAVAGDTLTVQTPVEALTPREREVLLLMAQGLGTKAIAQRLVFTPATVRNHVQRILSKLGAHTRLEAVAQASRYSMLPSLTPHAKEAGPSRN